MPRQLKNEVFVGDAAEFLQRRGGEFVPERTVVMTEPPWPTDPDPEAASVWRLVARRLPLIADRILLWRGCRTDPRWITGPLPTYFPFLEEKWLECRSPGGHVHAVAEVVSILGRSAWACGPPVLSEVVDKTTRPHALSCGLGHARQLVASCVPDGWLVFDPFCGSGTMLVAAAEAGRDYIGLDRCPEHVEVAEQRLRAAR